MMKQTWLAICLLMLCGAALAQPTIDATNWPYGSDQIGNNWQYYNTSANVAISIATIDPYQQGGAWDFTTGPTGTTASSEIRTVAAAPGPAPANTSYTEYQTSSGSSQWVYEDEVAAGTMARGIAQGGTVYPYDAPQWNIYHYPMTMGTIWSSSWTWGEQQLGVPIQSVRSNEIVGWGTVTVPFGGPLPCLVIRTLSTDYAEYMGIPLIDEAYRIYEWIVPNIGSVATIQSVSHETNWYFNTASGFYRLNGSNLGGDLMAPSITDVTDLPDTPNPGPYTVTATIVDSSGLDSVAILYSVAGGSFTALGPDGVNGNEYFFEIPQLIGLPVQEVRYYIWARDASPNGNVATNPPNAPLEFYAFSWINDNLSPAFSNVTIWPSPTYFNGPYPVNATITDDNGVLFASIHYKFGSGAWEEAPADSSVGNVYSFTIPAISSTTIIRYYLEAVDNSGFFNTGYYPAAGMNGPVVFQAVFTVPAPPQEISDLTIYPDGTDIHLNWSPVTQDINGNPATISEYRIYRGLEVDGSDRLMIGSTQTTSYADEDVTSSGNSFIYSVTAVSP